MRECDKLQQRVGEIAYFYQGGHVWSGDPDEDYDSSDLLDRIEKGTSEGQDYTPEDYKKMLYNTLEILREAMEDSWHDHKDDGTCECIHNPPIINK